MMLLRLMTVNNSISCCIEQRRIFYRAVGQKTFQIFPYSNSSLENSLGVLFALPSPGSKNGMGIQWMWRERITMGRVFQKWDIYLNVTRCVQGDECCAGGVDVSLLLDKIRRSAAIWACLLGGVVEEYTMKETQHASKSVVLVCSSLERMRTKGTAKSCWGARAVVAKLFVFGDCFHWQTDEVHYVYPRGIIVASGV
jgi:hypothetical protein